MGNSLGVKLEGMRAVVKAEFLAAEYADEASRTVDAQGGFGCSPDSMGNAVFARFPDGIVRRIEGYMFERLVGPTPEDEKEIAYDVTLLDSSGGIARGVGRVRAATDSEAARKALESAGLREPGDGIGFDVFTGTMIFKDKTGRYTVRAVRAS